MFLIINQVFELADSILSEFFHILKLLFKKKYNTYFKKSICVENSKSQKKKTPKHKTCSCLYFQLNFSNKQNSPTYLIYHKEM